MRHGNPSTPTKTVQSSAARNRRTAAELCIGFACFECRCFVSVPVRRRESIVSCPNCSTVLSPPTLNAELAGFEAVWQVGNKAATADWHCRCPGCQRRLRVPPYARNRRFRCPGCKLSLTTAVIANQKNAQVTSAFHEPGTTTPSSQLASDRNAHPNSTKPASNQSNQTQEPDPNELQVADEDLLLETSPTVAETPSDTVAATPFAGRAMFIRPWYIQLSLYVALHWLMPVTLTLISAFSQQAFRELSTLGGCFSCTWIVFGFYPSWWLASWLTPLFVHRLHCRRCGFDIDPFGVWSVGDYTDYRERHILRVRHPLNGTRVGYLSCPQCDSTILL